MQVLGASSIRVALRCPSFDLLQRRLDSSHIWQNPHAGQWRAGFFDGDGCIGMSKWAAGYVCPYVHVRQAVSKDAALTLQHFQDAYGGTVTESHWSTKQNANHRPVYTWKLSGSKIFSVLEDLLVGGLCIKRPQAELLLAHASLFPGLQARSKLSQNIREAREELVCKQREVRVNELLDATMGLYKARLTRLLPARSQQYAYLGGFCDADACFSCKKTHIGTYFYTVEITQKNESFLQAIKHNVLDGKGSNVYTDKKGISKITIAATQQVLDLCSSMQPYMVSKRRQVDLILSRPPSEVAKAKLAAMHGNQYRARHQSPNTEIVDHLF